MTLTDGTPMPTAAVRSSAVAPVGAPSGPDRAPPAARTGARWRRLGLFAGVPACWVVVALVHPMVQADAIYEGLRHDVGLWVGVHVAQLVLATGLGAALWLAVRGRSGPAATLTRLAVPVYLVFFAAFDSVAGIGSGLALHHAESLTGGERAGAIGTAEYLLDNRWAGDMSALWSVAQVALVVAVLGTAVTLRRAGTRRLTWVAGFVGALACMHAGPPAAVGLVALGTALWTAERQGALR
jgi:hypothetical protein